MTKLEKYLYQLRRIEEHRTAATEREIRKTYKGLLKELNGYIAEIYITYSEDDMLDYSALARASMDARFLEEVEQRISGITPRVATAIQETVEQTYEACYDGMRNAVVKAAGNRELLKKAFESVSAVTPDVIKRAVENPVSGLTLKDTLEKHRREIIYDIKRNIGVGLTNGDRYSTMAKRIAESLDGDYKKSIRIVRTETHRVRESGFNDAATAINDTLKQGSSGYVMAKTWHTMGDERVRPQKAKGKSRKYNHVKMDGVTIPQDDLFVLPSGATGKAPSQTGVAGEDINCRCYLSYDLVLASELTKVQDGKKTIEEAAEVEPTPAGKYTDVQDAYAKVNLNGIEEEFKGEIEEELLMLANKYPIHTKELTIKTNTSRSEFGHSTCGVRGSNRQDGYYAVSDIHIAYNKGYHKTAEISQKYHERTYTTRGSKLAKAAGIAKGTISHEYAHQIDNYYLFMKKPELLEGVRLFNKPTLLNLYNRAEINTINRLNQEIAHSNEKLSSVIFNRMASELGLNSVDMYREIRANYGTYAGTNEGEFLAEGFANMLNVDDKDKTDFMRLFEKTFNEEFDTVIRGK